MPDSQSTHHPPQEQERQPGLRSEMEPKPRSQGAIVAFTHSLAENLKGRRIRVRAVAPGPVWTPLIPVSFPAEHVAQFGGKTFLGRPAEPDEIAPSYVFLASDEAICMTGQVLHPNGGEIVGG